MNRRRKIRCALILAVMAASVASEMGAQTVVRHPFPRTAVFQWGGAPEEWYAKFDLCMTRITDRDFIAGVKKINPNTIWLPARDFNRADEFYPGFQQEWFLHDSRGKRIPLYGPDNFWADYSDMAPAVNGRKLIEEFPKLLAEMVRKSGADGIASDGLYYRVHLQYYMFADVDLDRNGTNDLVEVGKGKQWVIDHWANGIDKFLANLRREMGNKIIMLNTGSPDAPGVTLVNGYVAENSAGEYNWNYTRKGVANIEAKVRDPFVFLVNHHTDPGDPRRIRPGKNDFPFMRFGLGRTMLLDQYFEFEDFDQHYWNKYYNEFDLDLGYPTGPMERVVSTGPFDQGVWARFFDHGAVVVNFSTNDITVTSEQLSGLSGYQGPYRRFRGGQDPVMNNGALFDRVTLKGHAVGQLNAIFGDAILLVKTPTTVVSDICIDNCDSGTSPGSEAATLSVGWTQQPCGCGCGYYTIRCAEQFASYGYAKAAAGTGNATATFRPSIGIPGNYEVFEWHGRHSHSGAVTTEATNVPCVITYSGGSRTLALDQRAKPGQWNSLGVFPFAKGATGNVTISNKAGGDVIADAFKFVYVGEKSKKRQATASGSEL